MVRKREATDYVKRLVDFDLVPILVDVRTYEEFVAGHIETAHHYPLATLDQVEDHLPPDSEIVLVSNEEKRATEAAHYLWELGFLEVYVLAGGMKAWPGEIVQGDLRW